MKQTSISRTHQNRWSEWPHSPNFNEITICLPKRAAFVSHWKSVFFANNHNFCSLFTYIVRGARIFQICIQGLIFNILFQSCLLHLFNIVVQHILWKIGVHAETGKEMSRFCNLFGSRPDFHPFHRMSTEREVVSPCICQVWWALFSILINYCITIFMDDAREKWGLIENEYLGKIIYILGSWECCFVHSHTFVTVSLLPCCKKKLKKLSLQDLLFENLKNKYYVSLFFRLLLVERLWSRTIWVSWDIQS